MSTTVHAPAQRRRLVSQETFETVLGTVYAGLVTNVLLVISCLPLVVLLVSTDPSRSWPVLALLAPLTAPAYAAASAVFAELSADGTSSAVRTFVRAYVTSWRRALAIGMAATAAVVILAVDIVVLWEFRIGALAIPVLAMLTVLTVVTTLVALVAVIELPGTRLRDVLRISLYAAVRRWYLSAFSLVVLATLASLLAVRPAVALGLAAAPLLYVVWGGSRYSLRAVVTNPSGGAGRQPPTQ
jgi:uncharacterized membrane protein YesL